LKHCSNFFRRSDFAGDLDGDVEAKFCTNIALKQKKSGKNLPTTFTMQTGRVAVAKKKYSKDAKLKRNCNKTHHMTPMSTTTAQTTHTTAPAG
jgi:hypothetical protein